MRALFAMFWYRPMTQTALSWRCFFEHATGAPFQEDGRLKVRCSECGWTSPGMVLLAGGTREDSAHLVDRSAHGGDGPVA